MKSNLNPRRKMEHVHLDRISVMIMPRISMYAEFSVTRLKNRYDEIKERDEAIKTDYFNVIMKGLDG